MPDAVIDKLIATYEAGEQPTDFDRLLKLQALELVRRGREYVDAADVRVREADQAGDQMLSQMLSQR